MCDQQSLRSACAYAQSDQRLCKSLEYAMSVKLFTEHNFEFLILKWGCTGSSESTLVKMLIVRNHVPWLISSGSALYAMLITVLKYLIWKFFSIITLICEMKHPMLIVLNQMEELIATQSRIVSLKQSIEIKIKCPPKKYYSFIFCLHLVQCVLKRASTCFLVQTALESICGLDEPTHSQSCQCLRCLLT